MHFATSTPRLFLLPALLVLALCVGCSASVDTTADDTTAERDAQTVAEEESTLHARAERIADEHVLIDGHIDVPYRLRRYEENISRSAPLGDFDYPRAKAGGLDAPFMSIYIPVERQDDYAGARALADSLIDMVEGFTERAPDKFAIAPSPQAVRRQSEQGLISLPMGLENGAPIGEDLSNLQHFYDRGIRYITLAHAEPNQISDSSYDEERLHGGLSDFGREVVREMNRLGMMVDVSHITDEAFDDVMEETQAPVIASHSSARHFTPGWERNMSDPMIQRLAENGGVIMINFGSSFLRDEYQDDDDPARENVSQFVERKGLPRSDSAAVRYYQKQRRAHPIGTVGDVADHIDHVVDLVGTEHVGLGSDYDGVFALPAGLQDVRAYPNLIEELLRRGYTEDEIAKILGGNLLRVWSEVEQGAE